MIRKFNFSALLCFFLALSTFAQTTEFTYQGRLTDGSLPANASYDFEFRLFPIAEGGSAIGTVQRTGVSVANGIFSVSLDFGNQFTGDDRYLEIAVSPAGAGTFTTLTPRQRITSAPHNIRSLSAANADTAANAIQLGGVAASQYVLTTDMRMSDSRDPLPGSGAYVQNTNTTQPGSSFNISGDGVSGGTLRANAVTSATQFNIGVSRVLAMGTASIFAGRLAGASATTGSGNSFFGESAGRFNTTSSNNSFFGREAGVVNTASDNSFFGAFAGTNNTTGTRNSFFGRAAGDTNTTANDNSFFGYNAGRLNTASRNSFFGSQSGDSTTSGANNAFFGYNTGAANVTGEGNSFFGYNAGAVNTVVGSSFFGRSAGESNTTGEFNSFFGYQAGRSNDTANNNSFFGYRAGEITKASGSFVNGSSNSFFGAFAGRLNISGRGNSFFGSGAGSESLGGDDNTFVGVSAGNFNTVGNNNTVIGANADVSLNNLSYATAIGAGAVVENSNTIVLGRLLDTTKVGNLVVGNNATFNAGGTTRLGVTYIDNHLYLPSTGGLSSGAPSLCKSSTTDIVGTCSSSLRFKTNVETYRIGLEMARLLRPISFNWIGDGSADIGFAAEEVAAIEPRFATYDKQGQIEGVKYAQLTTVLVNAVKEQQAQIKAQAEQIRQQGEQMDRLQREIEALKALVCGSNKDKGSCK